MSQRRAAKKQKRTQRRRREAHLQPVPDIGRATGSAITTAAPEDDPAGPDLQTMIAAALTEHPMELLSGISSLMTAFDPRQRGPFADLVGTMKAPSLRDLVDGLLAVRSPMTTAALHVVAVLAGDPATRRRVSRALAARHEPVPAWLPRLTEVVVDRVVAIGHVLGDGENLVLGVRLASGERFSALVYIDHNLGTLVKDALVMEEPIEDAVAVLVHELADPDVTVAELDPADARARITEAIETAAAMFPPFETDLWPGVRPLIEWLVRDLPAGGTGYVWPDWSEPDRERLADDFCGSSLGSPFDDDDHRALLDLILSFAADDLSGDPLRWSPVSVGVLLLDWIPTKVLAPEEHLARVPRLLRAFVRFSHDVRGVRAALTEETVAAIDRHEPEYLEAIGSQRPRLAAWETAMGFGPSDLTGLATEMTLSFLDAYAGSREALMALDTEPLPDEAFDWAEIPDDVRDRVGEVLGLVDAACEEHFNTELRTACRRFLRRVAVGDPAVFRGKGRADTAAAAVCWAVGRNNEVFSLWGGGPQVAELMGFFGLKRTVSQRARRLLLAAGIEEPQYGVVALRSPQLLEARRRAELIEQRDRVLAR